MLFDFLWWLVFSWITAILHFKYNNTKHKHFNILADCWYNTESPSKWKVFKLYPIQLWQGDLQLLWSSFLNCLLIRYPSQQLLFLYFFFFFLIKGCCVVNLMNIKSTCVIYVICFTFLFLYCWWCSGVVVRTPVSKRSGFEASHQLDPLCVAFAFCPCTCIASLQFLHIPSHSPTACIFGCLFMQRTLN